jgi:hypothetical protein
VIVEAANPGAALRFRSTRHGVLKGLPNTPIVLRGLGGQPWNGLLFHVNSTTGCRLEYCTVENANFGVISTDNWLYVDSCRFDNNTVGANMNTSGAITFAKTRFITNSTGVNFDLLGSPFLNSPFTPNSFEGNGAGIDAFTAGSIADARNCWWNDPSGPTTPRNPGGQGDSIVGAGEPGVQFSPFLTSPPDFNNTPPVTRMLGPGLTQLFASPDLQIPDFLLDQGTKYIVSWTAQDDDAVVSQRIDFSPDGHFPDRYFTLVSNIPASARSWEITIPGSCRVEPAAVLPGGGDRRQWPGRFRRGAGAGSLRQHHREPDDHHRLERADFYRWSAHSRYGLDRVGECWNDHAGRGSGIGWCRRSGFGHRRARGILPELSFCKHGSSAAGAASAQQLQ